MMDIVALRQALGPSDSQHFAKNLFKKIFIQCVSAKKMVNLQKKIALI